MPSPTSTTHRRENDGEMLACPRFTGPMDKAHYDHSTCCHSINHCSDNVVDAEFEASLSPPHLAEEKLTLPTSSIVFTINLTFGS